MVEKISNSMSRVPVEILVTVPLFILQHFTLLVLVDIFAPEHNNTTLLFLKYTFFSSVFFLIVSLLWLITKKTEGSKLIFRPLYKKLNSIIFGTTGLVAVFIMYFNTFVGVVGVFILSPENYIKNSGLLYLKLADYLNTFYIFESLINFSINNPFLFHFIDISYITFVPLLALMFPIILLSSISIGRQYATSLLLAIFIGVPMWLAMPTVSPAQMTFVETLPEFEKAADSELIININKLKEENHNTDWYESVTEITNMWQFLSDNGFGYAVSSNPSMHAAWGIILLWFVFKLKKLYGFLLSPVIIAEIIGTVLLLQHFVIDILIGAIVGTISILITAKLMKIEKQYMQVDENLWYGAFLSINRAVNFVGSRIASYFKN